MNQKLKKVSVSDYLREMLTERLKGASSQESGDAMNGRAMALLRLVVATRPRYLVRFENMQMDSSHFGESATLAVGPGLSYTSVEDIEGKPIGTTPSNFMYPRVYCDLNDLLLKVPDDEGDKNEEEGDKQSQARVRVEEDPVPPVA